MTLLYLNSNMMGAGEPELGKKLLVLFLQKLADSNHKVDLVGCVNSGIFLTTEENPALPHLQKLLAKGARIATCGTCLDHYQRREKLLIGEAGSMDMTVELFATVDRIIRP
jgi:hypothetical protein